MGSAFDELIIERSFVNWVKSCYYKRGRRKVDSKVSSKDYAYTYKKEHITYKKILGLIPVEISNDSELCMVEYFSKNVCKTIDENRIYSLFNKYNITTSEFQETSVQGYGTIVNDPSGKRVKQIIKKALNYEKMAIQENIYYRMPNMDEFKIHEMDKLYRQTEKEVLLKIGISFAEKICGSSNVEKIALKLPVEDYIVYKSAVQYYDHEGQEDGYSVYYSDFGLRALNNVEEYCGLGLAIAAHFLAKQGLDLETGLRENKIYAYIYEYIYADMKLGTYNIGIGFGIITGKKHEVKELQEWY